MSTEKMDIEQRRAFGAKGVDIFMKKARRYCPDLTFHKTKEQFAPFDIEIKRNGVVVAMVEVKHRHEWTAVAFPFPTIRIDYQKVAAAQKVAYPVIYAVLSLNGEDVRFYWNVAGIAGRFKPNLGGGAQWGVSYEVSNEEWGRNWGDLWRLLVQQYAA